MPNVAPKRMLAMIMVSSGVKPDVVCVDLNLKSNELKTIMTGDKDACLALDKDARNAD